MTRPSAISRAAATSRTGSSSGAICAGRARTVRSASGTAAGPYLATIGRSVSSPEYSSSGSHRSSSGAITSAGACHSTWHRGQVPRAPANARGPNSAQSLSSGWTRHSCEARARSIHNSRSPSCQCSADDPSTASPATTGGRPVGRGRSHGGDASTDGHCASPASGPAGPAAGSARTKAAAAGSSHPSRASDSPARERRWRSSRCRAVAPPPCAAAASRRSARTG
ncbi:hypothetical protein HUT16_03660 [Kitasatospora sp. NA04385]|uniref:hypothetical protein n=1 Tax=Kitasatospora sp. NA04385 TaxID=2742135 RepID=UPI00159165A7|nr:hypothetical protein [Kitasatospora sp. NA04385]QKW18281.1 hypothetical protein HUT16_03660 [Kitasatospora sp. NA04385]